MPEHSSCQPWETPLSLTDLSQSPLPQDRSPDLAGPIQSPRFTEEHGPQTNFRVNW